MLNKKIVAQICLSALEQNNIQQQYMRKGERVSKRAIEFIEFL